MSESLTREDANSVSDGIHEEPEDYDLVVIGSGTGGKLSAWALAGGGQKIAVVENRLVGGSCPTVACMPAKNVIHTAQVSSYAHRLPEFGIEAGRITVRMDQVRERKRRMVQGEIEGDSNLFRVTGAQIIRGRGRLVGPKLVQVIGEGGRTRLLRGRQILISTGSRAVIDDTPGLREANPLTHIEALELDAVPAHVIILGAGYTGLEFAQALRRFGAHVTVIDRSEHILSHEDPDVSEAIADLLQAEGVRILTRCEVRRVRGESGQHVNVEVRGPTGEETLQASHLLVATGRLPNTEDLGLDVAGVKVNPEGYIQVDERLETSAPGIFAVGDVAGTPKFTHAAFDDFRVFTTNYRGGQESTRHRLIPFVLFIDPEYARVGMNEAEACAQGLDYRLLKLPVSLVLRARAVMETRGFMKALIDLKSDRILGFSMLGMNAGEVVAAVHVAMFAGLPYTVFPQIMTSHPTMAEGLKFLFFPELSGSEVKRPTT